MSHITAAEIALWQAQGFAFDLLDVRRADVRAQHGADIAGARWHDPAAWLDWKDSISPARPVVLYCAKGHEIGQGLTATLRVLGVDARYLVNGMQGWLDEGRPTAPITPAAPAAGAPI
jgi:rhodanese-related sulfurtransferase